MLAASPAVAFVVLNKSLKSSIEPAPPEAITGTFTALLTAFTRSKANPFFVPSLFIDVKRISPAPSLTTLFTQSIVLR